jgi:toxin ParE1/3/4
LEEIGDFIAIDNPERAVSFVAEIRSRAKDLLAFPQAGPVRDSLGEEMRVLPVGDYLILYRIADHAIRIERILHGRRRL